MGPRKSITLLLAGTALTTLPAAAQEVGTATAVNPSAQGAAPSAAKLVALTVGARIVHKERIQTSPSGTVQLLFLDKSTLSIAPNTNLLIDEFVFNPSAGSGHSAITLAEGAFRYVGGLVSHQGEAQVTTSAAVIGIRGGTVTIKHHAKRGTRIINHYGIITIQNGCGKVVIRRPGFAVTVLDWFTCPREPERVLEAETDEDLRTMTSLPWQNGGVPGVDNARIVGFGIGALQGNIGPNTAPVPIGNGESDAFQLIIQATQHATGRIPPPAPPPPPPQLSPPPPPPPPPLSPPPPPPPPRRRRLRRRRPAATAAAAAAAAALRRRERDRGYRRRSDSCFAEIAMTDACLPAPSNRSNSSGELKLIAYAIDGHHIEIRPAPIDRDWMDRTNQRFAYRCLPVNIANAYGWEILCSSGFVSVWNGEDDLPAISIVPDSEAPPPAVSHFGHGVLTFHVPCLFRTEPGFDLMVQGPINRPKDAIAALSGVIETDWSPYSFTMNWIFTRPGNAGAVREGRTFLSHFSNAAQRSRCRSSRKFAL